MSLSLASVPDPKNRVNRPAPKMKRPAPQLGLGALWIGKEEEEAVMDVMRRKELFRYYGRDPKNPPPVAAALEKEFREWIGSKYALAVTSGTAALEVALGALGVGPGDEVILAAWSWISCYTSVVRLGARPVLAEIDETFCIAPGEISRLKTARTKVVIVVHFQGVAADMEPILKEAQTAGIKVLEDCAESPGAFYKGRRVGSIGDIGTFSFQYQKSMTCGEGGMVATNDPLLYERAVRMHDIGQVRPYHANIVTPTQLSFSGSQFRMSELHAAVALAQLRKLDKLREHCRRLSGLIMERTQELQGLKPREIPDPKGDSGFELYFFTEDPKKAEAFRQGFREWNVNCVQMTGTYCHYAKEYCSHRTAHAPGASPFATEKVWPAKGYRKEDFPRTENLIGRFIAIPLGVAYTEEDALYIADVIGYLHDRICG